MKWVEECGHVPHLEQPEETASTILNFLTSQKVVKASAAAAKTKRNNGASSASKGDSPLDLPPYIIGGVFLGAVSGAYLLEEVIRIFIGL